MLLLFKLIAWLPLRANLALAGLDLPAIRRSAVAEAGKQVFEAAWFWLRPAADVAACVQDAQPGALDALPAESAG